VSPAWSALCRATEVIPVVHARLEEMGAVIELDQFARLSAQEMDLLVERERLVGV
jgi:hypothetical protein